MSGEKRPWDSHEEAVLYDGLLAGDTVTAISQRIGRRISQVYNKMRHEGWQGIVERARAERPAIGGRILQPHERPIEAPPAFPLDPVRPFAVEVPKAPAIHTGKVLTALVYGDTHLPFHDEGALRVVQAVAQDLKPSVLLHVGDLVDCWQISRFDKDPTRKDSLQDNIDAAREHLAQMAMIAPKARRVLLEGNHENRLTRTIWGLDGAARELPKLRLFQQSMTWPTLLETDKIGWEWIPERVQSKTPVLPKIITKHGTVVRKWSAFTAKGEWEKYGASGVSGHTHRLGAFYHRDHNGAAAWIETGCTCLLDPPYGSDFDWLQGCVVLTWSADRRLMAEDIIRIRDGSALWRGHEVAA